jgi:hypothetical protein
MNSTRRTKRTDAATAKQPSTPDEIRIAINHLNTRIVNEYGGQAACDRLEEELQGLVAQIEATVVRPVSRKTTTRMNNVDPLEPIAVPEPPQKPPTRRGSKRNT